jgi:hypothetical protein
MISLWTMSAAFLLAAAPLEAQAQQPDFAALLAEQFKACATVGPDQAPRGAVLRVRLNRQGRVVGEPMVVDPGEDEQARVFEQAAREGLKSCGPYRLAKTHPGAFSRWRSLEVRVSSGTLRRDPGWAGGRSLSGGAAEQIPIVLKPGDDFAAMGAFTTLDGECKAIAQGRVTIERQAARGRVRSYIGPSPVQFAPGHRLAHCGRVMVDGVIVRYDRRGKKPGSDSFRFVVRFENGEVRVIEARVTLQ